jgi:hypothetical protein
LLLAGGEAAAAVGRLLVAKLFLNASCRCTYTHHVPLHTISIGVEDFVLISGDYGREGKGKDLFGF